MKKTRIALTLALLLAIVAGFAANSQAQTKLEEKTGLAKLIGNWAATTDDGSPVNLSYRWGLNKNAVISRYDIGGQYAGYGLVYYNPSDGKILYAGVDSVGGFGKGHWQFTDDNAVWKMNYVGPDSQERKMGVVYTRDGRKALKMEYYGLDDDGELTGEPGWTTEFQRQAKKPAKKKSKLPESSESATLGDLVEMGGFGWLIGNWAATTDQGQSFSSSYRWSMNKNLINVTFKFGEVEGLGMIFYAPQEGKVMQVGADSRGSVTKGFWDADGDNLVATLDYVSLDGNKGKIAINYTKIDGKTMKVAFYGLDESGERTGDPWASVEYKRQPRPKKTAAKTKANN